MDPGPNTKVKRTSRRGRLPGYGWSPRLTGLEWPSQWMGFFLGTVIVFLVVIIGGFLLALFGVW